MLNWVSHVHSYIFNVELIKTILIGSNTNGQNIIQYRKLYPIVMIILLFVTNSNYLTKNFRDSSETKLKSCVNHRIRGWKNVLFIIFILPDSLDISWYNFCWKRSSLVVSESIEDTETVDNQPKINFFMIWKMTKGELQCLIYFFNIINLSKLL